MAVISGNKILVGIDGSPNASAALEWAIGEARVRHASIECLYVWHEPNIAYGAAGYFPLSQDDIDGLGRDMLHGALSTISGLTDDVKIDLRAFIGVPVEFLRRQRRRTTLSWLCSTRAGKGGVNGSDCWVRLATL